MWGYFPCDDFHIHYLKCLAVSATNGDPTCSLSSLWHSILKIHSSVIECWMVLFNDSVWQRHIIWCICRGKHKILLHPAAAPPEDFFFTLIFFLVNIYCRIFRNKIIDLCIMLMLIRKRCEMSLNTVWITPILFSSLTLISFVPFCYLFISFSNHKLFRQNHILIKQDKAVQRTSQNIALMATDKGWDRRHHSSNSLGPICDLQYKLTRLQKLFQFYWDVHQQWDEMKFSKAAGNHFFFGDLAYPPTTCTPKSRSNDRWIILQMEAHDVWPKGMRRMTVEL